LAQQFTVDQILGFPSPDNLVASPVGSTIAWTVNERGVRNIYVAEAPRFQPRPITSYTADDGQELTQLAFSRSGARVVYVRGGDHGSGRSGDAPPDPSGSPIPSRVEVWSASVTDDEEPTLIGEGDGPVISPDGLRIAFVRERLIWIAPIDGSTKAQPAFYARGIIESPAWSPDSRTLAFVANRGDHSFVGLFTPGQPIRYLAPSTSRDTLPAWSPDGRKIAFLRQPGAGGKPRSPLVRAESPWQILVASATDADGSVTVALTSGDNPVDPILQHPGGLGFRWGAEDHLVLLLYRDGFPHLYSIEHPGSGRPILLTPGAFMVEHVTLTPDRRSIVYTANTGSDPNDLARRHLFKVPIDAATPTPLTAGSGIEWSPVVMGNGRTVAYLSAEAQRPPMPAVIPLAGGTPRPVGTELLDPNFPAAELVMPELVRFQASDGVEVHGQLFKPRKSAGRMPAIVYVHGGGPRQMLLGWHYRWEYANDYGANQYLASRGFVVLSVDYRLSVGYGEAFEFAEHTGARGAAEYLDVLAAGRYLQTRPDVDASRIGIWGPSLGGYLTALGLGRNSDVFAAGVDVHGVHDRLAGINPDLFAHAIVGDGLTEADLRRALDVQYQSSPIASVDTWKSPVLLIHGDDDRTVGFHQTVDLARRLREKGVHVEELVLPDEVHDALLWRNWRNSIGALAQFFEQELQGAARR
jgi:dipeptidyl aminopeptidase/acylaminoacyl peptidase